MRLPPLLIFATTIAALLAPAANSATVSIGAGTYTENFNGLGTSLPAGWDGRTGATASTLGTAATVGTGAIAWSDTAGTFKNFSAGDISSASSTATQAANTNRALGVRQTGSFGDSGAAFNFDFSTVGVNVSAISIDLSMLSVQARSTTWSIQYGVGAAPASFTTLATWSDPGVFGTSTFTFDSDDFGSSLNNQANLWFRIVSLATSTGTGSRDSMGIDNFSITATAVPEPAAALLGSLGLLGLLRRRR